MPFSAKQIEHILGDGDVPIVQPADVPHRALRITESYIRRKLYAYEDRLALELYGHYKQTYKRLNMAAGVLASEARLDKLRLNSAGIRWRDALAVYAAQEVAKLERASLKTALHYSVGGWWGGYLGHAWQIAQSTTAKPYIPLPGSATARTLNVVREAYAVDETLLDSLIAKEWKLTFAPNFARLRADISASLNTSLTSGVDYRVAIGRIRDLFGLYSAGKAKGSYAQIEALVRTAYMDAANRGAVDLYRANPNIVSGMRFLAANDGRVCALCRGYNGRIWAVGDVTAVIPPRDTHPRCRCTVVPEVDPALWIEPTYTPKQTLSEWLTGLGLAWLLDDFLRRPTKLDSSQVGDERDYDWMM